MWIYLSPTAWSYTMFWATVGVWAAARDVPWFEYYLWWKELCGNTFISPMLRPRVSSWISNSLLMISTAENPWPLITFNLRERKNRAGGGVRPIGGRLKKNIFFLYGHVWEGYYLCLAVRGSKAPAGALTHVFWFEFLVTASNGRLLQLVNNGANHLLILQPQLFVDDLHIPHWVHCPLNMDDILIFKSTCRDRTHRGYPSIGFLFLLFAATTYAGTSTSRGRHSGASG